VISKQAIDNFAANLPDEVKASVRDGTTSSYDKRLEAMEADYEDVDALRALAGQIKQHTVDHLDDYLRQAEARLAERRITVHYAWDPEAARRIVLDILAQRGATRVVKSKSMVSEEAALTAFLTAQGIETTESDLGEFIVQLDEDHPSHVVKPIIHKNRRQIAITFQQHGLGDYDEDPEGITRRARTFMRERFLAADAAISGANFVSAESGRIAVVTNEGNSRFGVAAAPLCIVLTGIEKLLPRDRDFGLFLSLLARSATGQRMTSYVEFLHGPRLDTQPDGPEEMHLVFMNNHRTEALGTPFSSALRCIRCGACMNVCPVYRQTSGHAYRNVYPGPIGAVLDPILAGPEGFAEQADLARASTLCGACNEVCPVNIPIPDLLVRHRTRAVEENARIANLGTPPMGGWARLATSPRTWRAGMNASNAMNYVPLDLLPVYPVRAWLEQRELPDWRGGHFRSWMRKRDGHDKAGTDTRPSEVAGKGSQDE
jgi:L-lactate dehydrogenase complex protein LldF